MPFVRYGSPADVTLGVVAYGVTGRLLDCLDSLVSHESRADFDIVCVLNPDERDHEPDPRSIPAGVHVVLPEANLGWAGGMHLVRHATTASWIGWIQDDSHMLPGWLDAHLAAGAAHPRAGALGAVAVDHDGRPEGFSGGWARPADRLGEWNLTDPSIDGEIPPGTEKRDWITSKGMLSRAAAWDDVGGPCARQYPLNHVDKEFSTHLRAHGWEVLVVPGARVSHQQSMSSPSLFRRFLVTWHDEATGRRLTPIVEALADGEARIVAHDCHGHPDVATVERECLREASRMLVPLSRLAATEAAEAYAAAERHARFADELRGTLSWRLTAPLRRANGVARRWRGRS